MAKHHEAKPPLLGDVDILWPAHFLPSAPFASWWNHYLTSGGELLSSVLLSLPLNRDLLRPDPHHGSMFSLTLPVPEGYMGFERAVTALLGGRSVSTWSSHHLQSVIFSCLSFGWWWSISYFIPAVHSSFPHLSLENCWEILFLLTVLWEQLWPLFLLPADQGSHGSPWSGSLSPERSLSSGFLGCLARPPVLPLQVWCNSCDSIWKLKSEEISDMFK